MKKKWLSSFIGVSLTLASIIGIAAEQKPNVILIVTDEHNFRTIGAYRDQLSKEQAYMWGETVVETPHIDRIADEGALFTSMYAASPVCTPSRASMFTGMYPQNTGAPRNDMVMHQHLPTIANDFANNGYMTGYVGKWHLSGKAKPGWAPEYNYGFKDNRYMFNRGHWKALDMDQNGKPFVPNLKDEIQRISMSKVTDKTYVTDFVTNRSLEFIERNKDNPFFITISQPDPHTPNMVRTPYNTMYKNMQVKIPHTYDTHGKKPVAPWLKPDKKVTEAKIKKDVKQYYGMVKLLDDSMGRLFAKLEQVGILDNTIIVFSSDHGDFLGEHHKENKGPINEASGLIPFMVRYPKKIPQGLIVKQAANNTDWMDTIIALAGASEHDYAATEGRDLTPLLTKNAPNNWNDVTFSRWNNWFAAVTDRYKLIYTTSKKMPVEPILYDLEKDPDEKVNYINSKAHQAVIKQLTKELKGYLAKTKDPMGDNPSVQKQMKQYF
jgi:uncharacterized sulfatase